MRESRRGKTRERGRKRGRERKEKEKERENERERAIERGRARHNERESKRDIIYVYAHTSTLTTVQEKNLFDALPTLSIYIHIRVRVHAQTQVENFILWNKSAKTSTSLLHCLYIYAYCMCKYTQASTHGTAFYHSARAGAELALGTLSNKIGSFSNIRNI